MFKSSMKPVWVRLLIVAGVLAAVYKLALAMTAFIPANQPVGYVAQDEITSYNLKSGNEIVFRGEYEREFWSGTLFAYKADANGNLTGGTVWWTGDAAELISAQNHDTERFIATMKSDGTAVAFRRSSLATGQQALIDADDTKADRIIDYVRGDRTNEIPAPSGTMRQRVSVVGDIIHSRPYYVADATHPTLFVGANDGMLHAINAANDAGGGGRERWAYVPSMLLPKLKQLTVDPYVHDYYVDGQINVAAIASGTKRVLVGGLGSGGKGLYALDITGSSGLAATSEADVAAKVKWEITPTKLNYGNPTEKNAYANLGYTYGTVTIGKVKVGATVTDAVIVGNGYNDGVGDYSGCTDATTYAGCGGDYAAYLYIINADTGQLIQAIKATGSGGTAVSPNGLSTPAAIDTDGDGIIDRVYAGDLNGSMWKFDLVTGVTTELLATSPAQPITSTPGVAVHPTRGYMVTFGTGKVLAPGDLTDTSVHYVYGIWDGAPAANTKLLEQTLTERVFTIDSVNTRVRNVTSLAPVWTSGALNHKGWRVALPAGERVVGEGSFIESGRFYFTASNPTLSNAIADTTSEVPGEAWLMELDYLTGGAKNKPFLDLSGDVKLDNGDRIKYIAGDTIPTGSAVGDPILTADGVAVGKFISIGLLSQPILVQLNTLNDTLFNQNPDIVVDYPQVDRGVEGGHFDVEIYYGPKSKAIAATATIEVGTTGQTGPYAATLGAITVDGVSVVPALTVSDLKNGIATETNADKIRSRVRNGFKATVSGNTVTIKAPVGMNYNGMTLDIADGTSKALNPGNSVPGSAPAPGRVVITGTTRNSTTLSIKCGGTYVTGAPGNISSPNVADTDARLDDLFNKISGKTVNGYGTTCTKGAGSLDCSISAPVGAAACTSFTLARITASTNSGPQGGENPIPTKPPSGWTNFKPALTTTVFSGAVDAEVAGNTCSNGTERCTFQEHEHEYDDIFDRTGVNFLNASNPAYNLSRALLSTETQFKVIAQNQYLNPAVRLHIGNPTYTYNIDAGYIAIKDYQTSATLDLATVPTYTRDTIGSLALNLPFDAFDNKDWWGGKNGLPADVRDGLHPTEYGCVVQSNSATRDGNMYQPVDPPETVTVTGNGTKGWSASTTQLTATGARHNGAITLQIIKADTPNSAIELSVPNRPEYGWRVKAGDFSTYVLAEYSMFHHTKHLGVCYGDTKWTKTPVADKRACGKVDSKTTKKCAVAQEPGTATDPLVGNLGGGSSVVDGGVTQTVVGDVTTTVIKYVSGLTITITRTTNADGSITITTRDQDGNAVAPDQRIANKGGAGKKGGNERGLSAHIGRISWRELVAP